MGATRTTIGRLETCRVSRYVFLYFLFFCSTKGYTITVERTVGYTGAPDISRGMFSSYFFFALFTGTLLRVNKWLLIQVLLKSSCLAAPIFWIVLQGLVLSRSQKASEIKDRGPGLQKTAKNRSKPVVTGSVINALKWGIYRQNPGLACKKIL